MIRRVKKIAAMGLFAVIWQVWGSYMPQFIPSPIAVGRAFVFSLYVQEPIMGRTLCEHALMSLFRVAIGSSCAFVAAVSLGIILGYYRRFSEYILWFIEAFRPIPPLAWAPLSLMIFKGQGPLFIVFLGVFFPAFSCTFEGVRSVEREWLEYGKLMKMDTMQLIRKIIIPASMPQIMNGIRIGVGVGWMCIVAAEMISFSSVGIGQYIMVMYDIGKIDQMLAGMLGIGLIGYVVHVVFSSLSARFRYVC